MKKRWRLLIFLSLIFSTVYGQQMLKVSGRVTAVSDRQGIPGVTVRLLNTQQGTVTDAAGNYMIEAPSDGTLVFSFIGMKTQEIAIKGRVRIDVEMVDEKYNLGEIVVMGYSTDSRKLIGGSVALVRSDEMKTIPMRTIDGVLQGKAAGLNIFSNSGTPGAQPSIRLRGGSSINASNSPLIVVDGIPVITGDLSQVGFSGQVIDALTDINPNEIETVTVLKDASATVIYGARASNGVILITTRKGNSQQTSVSIGSNYGWQEIPSHRLPKLLNAQQWNEYKGTSVQGVDTDWLKEILRTAPVTNTELSISSGNASTRVFFAGTYFKQDGVVLGTSYDRYNGRVNLDHNLSQSLKMGANVSLGYSRNARVEGDQTLNGPLPNALSIPAIYPVYNPDGTYNEDGPYANPVAIARESVNLALTNRSQGNVFAEYRFWDHFIFTTKWGADIYNLREHSYDPITTRQGKRYNGLAIEGTTYASNLVSSNVISYSRTFHEKHQVDGLLGLSTERYARRNTYIEALDFPNEKLQYVVSAGTIRAASASALDRSMLSYFGQLKYSYLYKYIVTMNARADGSSKFGKNNRFGYFPALALAWRASEENFLKSVAWLSDLKVRLSVGMTGNDGIPDFASLGLYAGGFNYGGSSGTAPVQLPNPDLKWETNRQTNLGFDMGLWNDRLTLNLDMYYNKTYDLLLARPLPPSSGFSSIYANIGELENKGLEISLNSKNLDTRLVWNTAFNFSMNRNKVLKLYEGQPIDDIGRGGNRVQEGEPLGIFYGYKCLGVDPTTGNLVYEDINKDGKLTADDRTKIGDPNPDFTAGLNNTFTYAGFDLGIFLQWVYGNDIFNGTRIYLESGTGEDNQTTAILRRWRKPGDITDVPRVGDTYKSSRFIEDGSFLRVKNLTLGYTLKNKRGFKQARIYLSAQNLLTFTQYSGMDPEVNYAGGDNLRLGTDFFTYPQVRTISLGINLEF